MLRVCAWSLMLLLPTLVHPAGADADHDVTLTLGGAGGGWSSFVLAPAAGDIVFEFDSRAFGAASYGADLYDSAGRHVASLRATGRDDGDSISAGTMELGASATVPQPVLASGAWRLTVMGGIGCSGARMSWNFSQPLRHHLTLAMHGCSPAGEAYRGVAYGAGEQIIERGLRVRAPAGSAMHAVETTDEAFFLTAEDYDGSGAEARALGWHALIAADRTARIHVANGFFGAFETGSTRVPPPEVRLAYEGPEGTRTCPCWSIAEPEAAGSRMFTLDAQHTGSNTWLVAAGVDARLPPLTTS